MRHLGPYFDHLALLAAIVDLDGTLVDTLGDFEAALNRMLRDLNQAPVDRALIAQCVGKGSENLIKSIFWYTLPGSDASKNIAIKDLYPVAWQSYQRHYRAINGQYSQVFPGAKEGLQALQNRGLKLACLTNKPTGLAKELLAAKGLAGFFQAVYGGDAFARKKPDPLPLLKTCQALGTVPGQTLMVGDSSNDAQAARAAGCPVVLVTYGYNHGQPVRQVDADAFLDSLADLCS